MVKLLKSEVLKMVEVHKPIIRLGLVAILILMYITTTPQNA
ncbi:hypothetical protein [Clostridium algoriphilum]|nr:hypothetical protein [Clostridium algoriphilum]